MGGPDDEYRTSTPPTSVIRGSHLTDVGPRAGAEDDAMPAPLPRRTALLLCAAVAVALGGGACAGSAPAPSAPPTAPPVATAAPVSVSAPVPAPATTRPASAPASGGAAAPARCTSAQLAVTLGAAEGAAGSVYRPLVFTNRGTRVCELRGFPGVSYVAGDDGHQVGPAAVMVGDRGPQVRIEPGRSAAAALQLVNVGAFDAAACRPTPVRGLRVYPPGETAALFVQADGTGCAGTPPGPQLSVRTIAAR